MTPDEIVAVAAAGHRFDIVHIAGGEPTLWRHFEAGLRAVKESGLSRRIEVSSNCLKHATLTEALAAGLVDLVYCQVSNSSPAGVEKILAAFPKDLIIGRNRLRHKPLPTAAMEGVLPAECGCDRPAVFAGRVYQCADVYPHSKRMGYDFDLEMAWVPVNDGSRDWLAAIKAMDRKRHPACRVCLANKRVWRRVE
jgi:hypothetical protein